MLVGERRRLSRASASASQQPPPSSHRAEQRRRATAGRGRLAADDHSLPTSLHHLLAILRCPLCVLHVVPHRCVRPRACRGASRKRGPREASYAQRPCSAFSLLPTFPPPSTMASSTSASLFLLLTLLALSLPSITAIFPFILQTRVAPWPARAQPSWQTTTRSIVNPDTNAVYRPGSMILYGGVNSNDSHTHTRSRTCTTTLHSPSLLSPLLVPLCADLSLPSSLCCQSGSRAPVRRWVACGI